MTQLMMQIDLWFFAGLVCGSLIAWGMFYK